MESGHGLGFIWTGAWIMDTEQDSRLSSDIKKIRKLTGPLTEAVARSLRVGDVVTVDGTIWGVRDATLIRIFDENDIPQVNLSGALLLHTAPSVSLREDGGYDPISVGTTTSMRMDRFTEGCVRKLGIRGIIGKGGLSHQSSTTLTECGAVYFSIVGGAASSETLQIEAIEEAYYTDLLPECLWKFRVRDFGPLFVTMDTTGASSYEQMIEKANSNLPEAYRILGI